MNCPFLSVPSFASNAKLDDRMSLEVSVLKDTNTESPLPDALQESNAKSAIVSAAPAWTVAWSAPPDSDWQFLNEMPESVRSCSTDNSNTAPVPEERVMLLMVVSVVKRVAALRVKRDFERVMSAAAEMIMCSRMRVPVSVMVKRESVSVAGTIMEKRLRVHSPATEKRIPLVLNCTLV